jgi:hypothetical protein
LLAAAFERYIYEIETRYNEHPDQTEMLKQQQWNHVHSQLFGLFSPANAQKAAPEICL